MRDINAIFADLQLCSLKNKEIAAHLEKVRFYLRENDSEKILISIHEGTNKFKSNAIFAMFSSNADKYANLLLELKKHFMAKSRINSQKRMRNLLNAIQTNDEEQVKNALNTGSTLIINDMDDNGLFPIVAAMQTKNLAIIRLLIRKGATLNQVLDVNQPINDQGDTLLHIACELGLNQFVVELLSRNANVNVKNARGATPLHTAIEFAQKDIAGLLLNKKADPNIKHDGFPQNYNAFLLAFHKKEYALASHMLKLGYKVKIADLNHVKRHKSDSYEAELLYWQMKTPIKKHKREIMFASNLQDSALFNDERLKHSAQQYAPLFKQVFFSDPEKKKLILSGMIYLHQHENQVLKPLLDALNLAMSGQRNPLNNPKHQKPLKALINAEQNTDSLTGKAEASGLFNKGNSVYVAGGRPVESVLATLLHEAKHFIDHEIYGDADKPYKESQKNHFLAVKEALYESLKTLPRDTKTNIRLYISIASIFTEYAEDKQDAEILVKVPEIIGLLGMDKGYKWLSQHTPSLLAFYEHRFNPACQEYVARIQEQLNTEMAAKPSPRNK